MTWTEYYDKFYDWSESTQVARLSSVTDVGPSAEVCEIAACFSDEKIATRLVRKAMAAGVRFSSEEVSDLEGVISDALFAELTGSLAGTMSWDFFCEHISDWAMPLQRTYALAQKEFGSSEDVLYAALELQDTAVSTAFIKNALAAGVRFTSDEVITLDGDVDSSVMFSLAMSVRGGLTAEELEVIEYNLSDQELEKLARHHHIRIEKQPCFEERWEEPKVHKKSGGGFFGALLVAGLAVLGGGSRKKHRGRCNGDCANCPSHYGYRYGRWYYGRHHQYGCQFGGNRGDCSFN